MADETIDILGPGRPIKLVDNGDDTYSIAVSGSVTMPDPMNITGTVEISSASRATLGEVVELSITPTITAGAYSIGDVGGSLLSFDFTTIPNYTAELWSGAQIQSVNIYDDANQKIGCKLYLYKSAPASIADNAAFAPSYADLKKTIGIATFVPGDYSTVNSNALALKGGLQINFPITSTVLYAFLVFDGAPTYAGTSDLTIEIVALAL